MYYKNRFLHHHLLIENITFSDIPWSVQAQSEKTVRYNCKLLWLWQSYPTELRTNYTLKICFSGIILPDNFRNNRQHWNGHKLLHKWINQLQFSYIEKLQTLSKRKCRDSAIGIATGYWLDDIRVGVRVPGRSRIFISPWPPDEFWGPLNILSHGHRWFLPWE
jgi:hypothetical protein